MEFSSVRAINKAVRDAAFGNLRGCYVYVKQFEDGKPQLRRISRARADRSGGLHVRLLQWGEETWIPCAWSEVVTR